MTPAIRHTLPALRTVALFALSLASRPLAEDFADSDAETVGITRPDFLALMHAAGLPLGRNTAYAALDELAEEGAPALRLIRHAGSATLVLGLVGLDDDIDEAWEMVLSDSVDETGLDLEALDDDDDDRSLVDITREVDLPALGLDTETPLPACFAPRHSHLIPAARRCPRCDVVKGAEAYGTRVGRLRSYCRVCEALTSSAWKAANPKAAQRAALHKGRQSTSRRNGFAFGPTA